MKSYLHFNLHLKVDRKMASLTSCFTSFQISCLTHVLNQSHPGSKEGQYARRKVWRNSENMQEGLKGYNLYDGAKHI